MNRPRWSSAICPFLPLVERQSGDEDAGRWLEDWGGLITVLAESNIVTNICLVYSFTTIWTYNMLILIHWYIPHHPTQQQIYFQNIFYYISFKFWIWTSDCQPPFSYWKYRSVTFEGESPIYMDHYQIRRKWCKSSCLNANIGKMVLTKVVTSEA